MSPSPLPRQSPSRDAVSLNARRMILVLAILVGLGAAAAINVGTWERSTDRLIQLARR